ncbi:MAG: GNAT family N-acetyltransferase [Betaproteobacteria bacterium]|nr:GNAT family N-acetyltransferase [Betaproteobacteria bacterium]
MRPLDSTDADAYRALMLDAYARHPAEFTSTVEERAVQPIEWWVRRIGGESTDARAFGAFREGELVGTVALEFATRTKMRHKATLIGMYVVEAGRRCGTGRQLVRTVLDAARARAGVRQVLLTVTEGNHPAQRLYESCGFEAFGTEPRALYADGRFRGKVHMWCDLERRSA